MRTVLFMALIAVYCCQITNNSYNSASLTSTTNNPPQLVLTFSTPLSISTPAFQIFTTNTEVGYQIISNTNNQTYLIKPTSPKDLLANSITLVFNQPLDLNLTVPSFYLNLDVVTGSFSTQTGPIIICSIIFVLCLFGNAGIMMVQFIQIYTELKAIRVFYALFINNMRDFMYYKWAPDIAPSINSLCFINSCFVIIVVYAITGIITFIIWKLLKQPQNPTLKRIKKIFTFSFMIVIYKITMIPLAVGMLENYLTFIHKPSINAVRIVNQIVCILFVLLYFAALAYIVWFMHYSKIEDYYEPKVHDAYRKIYMEVETNKGYKRFYVVYLYFKIVVMSLACILQFGLMFVVVLEDFQIFMIMITRPYKSYRYYQLMLFSVCSQFLSYLCESAIFMFKHLGVTLMENHATFVLGTTSLIFFVVACINLTVISFYEAYVKISSFVENFKWERRESDRMIEMNRLTKRESLLTSRSRKATKISV